jgi:hypothetical protein
MTSPAAQVKAVFPTDSSLRIGKATVSGGITTIRVSGTIVNCGFLDSVTISDGDKVALLRYGATWLCLGSVRATA